MRYETTGGDRRGWVTARYTAAARDRIQFPTLDNERLAALTYSASLESPDGARLFGPPHRLVRSDPAHAAAGAARRRGAHQSTSTGVPPASGR